MGTDESTPLKTVETKVIIHVHMFSLMVQCQRSRLAFHLYMFLILLFIQHIKSCFLSETMEPIRIIFHMNAPRGAKLW